jgi:hypothetical protein
LASFAGAISSSQSASADAGVSMMFYAGIAEELMRRDFSWSDRPTIGGYWRGDSFPA